MTPNTLVAMTISSSRAYLRSARPVISSLTPSEYMSAESKKLMPASTARAEEGLRGVLVEHPGAPVGIAIGHGSEADARDAESSAAEACVAHGGGGWRTTKHRGKLAFARRDRLVTVAVRCCDGKHLRCGGRAAVALLVAPVHFTRPTTDAVDFRPISQENASLHDSTAAKCSHRARARCVQLRPRAGPGHIADSPRVPRYHRAGHSAVGSVQRDPLRQRRHGCRRGNRDLRSGWYRRHRLQDLPL